LHCVDKHSQLNTAGVAVNNDSPEIMTPPSHYLPVNFSSSTPVNNDWGVQVYGSAECLFIVTPAHFF